MNHSAIKFAVKKHIATGKATNLAIWLVALETQLGTAKVSELYRQKEPIVAAPKAQEVSPVWDWVMQ